MFKNALNENLFRASKSGTAQDNHNNDFTQTYCVTEAFTGDLATGTIILGERTSALHGMDKRCSGLLALTRAYSIADRMRVLNVLERACTKSTHFTFHTTVQRDNCTDTLLLCTGETLVHSEGQRGVIKGVFVFSRSPLH